MARHKGIATRARKMVTVAIADARECGLVDPVDIWSFVGDQYSCYDVLDVKEMQDAASKAYARAAWKMALAELLPDPCIQVMPDSAGKAAG